MIHPVNGIAYSADGWGTELTENSIPIKAVFKIHQDDNNHILGLSPMHFFKFVCEQSFDVTAKNLPKGYYRRLLEQIGKLTRSVPGYELHFRKSADFWKLIDTEFNLA